MAKLSQTLRDQRRAALVRKFAPKRSELRTRLKDPNVPFEEKSAIVAALEKLPRNSCPTRIHHRCGLTGRARGYHSKFDLSRIALRDLALKGMLPGVRKSSW